MMVTTAALGTFTMPAHADYLMTTSSDGYCANGQFEDHGEWFYLLDRCYDGHSAVMRVDVEPVKSGNGYDFLLWNPDGYETMRSWNKSYPEGTAVCIQVGLGEYGSGTSWGYGSWTCGSA